MPATIFVEGLPHDFKKEHLLNLFSDFGVVRRAFVGTRRSGESSGFGYVIFSSMTKAQQAVRRLNGMVIMGNTLTVYIDNSRDPQADTGPASS
jgi:RNA recognition motif-containing protein